MVADADTDGYLTELAQYHRIEQQLLKREFDEERSSLDDYCEDILEPYVPFGANGPVITQTSSIPLLDR